MPMMSDRASSFPPVKMSWMRVAQRTLELFTHVRSTGEERRGGGWAPEAETLVAGHSHVQPELQEGGIPCSVPLPLHGAGSWRSPPLLPPRRPRPAPWWALTQAGHGEHAGGCGWGDTVGEHGLQYVVGEGHGDDSQAGGVHDEDRAPEQQEAEMSEDPRGIGIPSPSQ